MAYSQEVIDYAKDLFLVPDTDGTRKYSLRQITDKIQNDMGIKVHHSTVASWSEKGNWEQLWLDGVRAGFLDAVAEEENELNEKRRSQDEKIQAVISQNIKQRRLRIIQKLELSERFWYPDGEEDEYGNAIPTESGKTKAELREKGQYVPTSWMEAMNLWRYCMSELKDMEDREMERLKIEGEKSEKQRFKDSLEMLGSDEFRAQEIGVLLAINEKREKAKDENPETES
jgi:hypothetical protein